MKPITVKQSRFRLTNFLNALHKFSLENLCNGKPLPVVWVTPSTTTPSIWPRL